MSVALEYIAAPAATQWGDLLPEQLRQRQSALPASEQAALMRVRVLTDEEYRELAELVESQARDQAVDGFIRPGEPPRHPKQRGQFTRTPDGTVHEVGGFEDRGQRRLWENDKPTPASVYLEDWMAGNFSAAEHDLFRMYYHERLTQEEIGAALEENGFTLDHSNVSRRIARMQRRVHIESGVHRLMRASLDTLFRVTQPPGPLAELRRRVWARFDRKVDVPADAGCFHARAGGRGACGGRMQLAGTQLGADPTYYCQRHGRPSRLIEEWDPTAKRMRAVLLARYVDKLNTRVADDER